MLARFALTLSASAALVLMAGCSLGLGAQIAPMHLDRSASSGSASDVNGEHHDHAGHDHTGHDHSQSNLGQPSYQLSQPDYVAEPHLDHWADAHYGALHGHEHGEHSHTQHNHAHNDGDEHHPPRRLLRHNLRCGWCAPAEHDHTSACGTPYVHGFLTEPAFLGRDFFLDVTQSDDETEIEAELEWSLTKRLGLIVELPYIDAEETGIGDAALGIRILLVEEQRFLLSASTEVELPTGSESRGLGSGAFAVGASLHTWTDLGAWVTLQTVTGIEHVPDEDETEFKWSLALAKSFRACPLISTRTNDEHHHGPTAFSVIAEIQGVTALSDDAGETEGRWLLGASFPLAHNLDLRGAFSQTFGGDEDEDAWTVGVIVHF